MGRQQQFQVLKAALRRTLLRRFHSPPPASSSSHREREGPALLSRALSRLAEEHCNKASRSGCQSRELFSRDAPPRTGKCLPSEILRHPNAPAEVLLAESLHRSFAANPLPEHLRVASPWWAGGSAGLLTRVLPSSSSGGSRGLASLAAGAKQPAEDEAGRDGQGGDEGGSASVSGREFPDARRRRRKRKTPAEANVPPKVSTGRRISPVSRNDLNPSDANPPPPSDNVAGDPVRPARKKRSKEISVERIHQAFGESGDPSTPPVLGEVLTLRKPLVSLGVVEAQPVEASAAGKQSEISVEPICASQGPVRDGSVRNQPVGGDNLEDRENLRNGFAPPAPILVSPTDTRINQKEKAQKAAAKIDELVRQDDGETSSSEDAVEPVDETTSTDREKRMANGRNRNVSGALEVMEIGPDGDEGNSSANSSSEEQVLGTVTEADFSDPQALYKKLLESKGGRGYRNQEKSRLNSIFYRFAVSGWVSDQALSLYINSKFFPTAASKFRKFFMHKSSPELRSLLISKGATNEALQLLFPLFAEFCIHEFPSEISRYRELVNTADMTKPDAWYPFARAIKRKVVYHKGPTNSGKTYNALQRFMAAPSGIYCSPLRLLAMEVFDTVNVQGVYCNLHTGQERQTLPFANHLACTVEMCYLTQQWDVAVIDEIQMMSDEYRGWAWTRAFLGLQADEIHVCGDPSALPLIRNLCAGMGDDLEEHEYERFMPLKVAEESLRGDFRNIEAGDCIVAFSRRDIFDIKREVELASKHRCCVIYGALPPETRTQQAKLFNETSNGYSVLVASDAVGMGLNLNIRRVVFFSLDKFDGDSKKPVPPAQVKQIAGRAGRRNSLYPEGVTTTFFSQDLDYLRSSMAQDFEPATAAGLFPVFEQVELFASQLPNETFAKLLERFSETCKLDGAYFLSRYDNLKRVANMLEKVKGLSLEDRFNFCFAPVNVRDPESMAALFRYASAFSQKIPVCVEMGVPSTSAKDEFELLDLEARHQVLSMYLWLSQHFPGDLFPQREKAGDMASKIAVLLGQSLVQSSRRWSKRKLSHHPYRGRQFGNTGRTDNRQHVGAPAQEENFVRA